MKNLLGVVLCGGQSTRMGTDKGLMSIEDTQWAKHTANIMEELGIPVVLSINGSQRKNYTMLFPSEQCIADHNIHARGPLQGLLSIHQEYPTQDILLMACDMIDMDKLTLCHLINKYQSEPTFDFYVYQHKEHLEPFCGIYTSRGLLVIMNKINDNGLMNFSFQDILGKGNTKKIRSTDIKPFKNYNKISDIE